MKNQIMQLLIANNMENLDMKEVILIIIGIIIATISYKITKSIISFILFLIIVACVVIAGRNIL
jgi:hypothetical protein